MQIIADLHLHSKYSRAVSQSMTLEEIARFAYLKGINLVSTSDWTHPLWFKEIKEILKEVSSGIFSLKNSLDPKLENIKFILSTEISSIYSQGGKVRRIHNLVFSPSISTSERIIKELNNQGCNLTSDGRPIIGLSVKELLELILEIDKRCFLIPCHIWTPWFSLYGSNSGFDSINECFGNYSQYIYAVETGLSSDPIMNWQIKELENRQIVSFSDAHSGMKLGREATVFISQKEDFTYNDIINAFKNNPNSQIKIGYTIEFFPEEGKYHWSGHRNCQIRYSPEEMKQKGKICPVCQKPLTIGVEDRVWNLSEKFYKKEDLLFLKNSVGLTFVYDKEKKRRPFVSIIPLFEILLELNNNSQTKALKEFQRLTSINNEFDILLKKTYDEIEKIGGEKLRQAIKIIRDRQVFVDPGYDGVFGKVKIFKEKNDQIKIDQSQQSLF